MRFVMFCHIFTTLSQHIKRFIFFIIVFLSAISARLCSQPTANVILKRSFMLLLLLLFHVYEFTMMWHFWILNRICINMGPYWSLSMNEMKWEKKKKAHARNTFRIYVHRKTGARTQSHKNQKYNRNQCNSKTFFFSLVDTIQVFIGNLLILLLALWCFGSIF